MQRTTILGGGHGVASVLRALRQEEHGLTVIVTVADDGGSSGRLRQRWGGPAVGDLRRSIVALSDERAEAGIAFAAPLTLADVGQHPLGNLMLRSLIGAFGDLETASAWLCEHLGISARLLPATAEPVSLVAQAGETVLIGETAIGRTDVPIERLSFDPPSPEVPCAVIESIGHADCVLLAPGSLFTSALAVAALPDVRSALSRTAARIVWLCNLEPEPETAGMTAAEHLAALRRHNVQVDAVVYDPAAALRFAPSELAREPLQAWARRLRGRERGVHDPVLLRAVLREISRAPARPLRQSRQQVADDERSRARRSLHEAEERAEVTRRREAGDVEPVERGLEGLVEDREAVRDLDPVEHL